METYLILAVNPGSTSTKIAVYRDDKPLFVRTLRHDVAELASFKEVADQFAFRKDLILKALKEEGVDVASLRAVVGRGGLVKPIESGVYEVGEALKRDLRDGVMGKHASNLGGLIAADIAGDIPGAKAYIADPVVVDELEPVARLTGHRAFRRLSIFHALNQKAVARLYADSAGKRYEDLNLIVAHLGGGVSVGAHRRGRVVDVNNALDGEGPMSPERSGTLPAGQLVDLCFDGKHSRAEVRRMIAGEGGLVSHLGSNDTIKALQAAESGDGTARLAVEAMCYGVGKAIGAMAAVLKGRVDAVLLTGGIAYSERVCAYIWDMVSFIAPVHVYPGEDEMQALALNGLRALRGEVTPKRYE